MANLQPRCLGGTGFPLLGQSDEHWFGGGERPATLSNLLSAVRAVSLSESQ